MSGRWGGCARPTPDKAESGGFRARGLPAQLLGRVLLVDTLAEARYKLALALLERAKADAIHIATEGTIGHAVRRVCLRRGVPFTTSFHTRFPDYIAERVRLAPRWSADLAWAWLRRFHRPGAAVLAATISPAMGA